MAVRLQAGEQDVEEPETEEQQAGQEAGHSGAAQLPADGGPAPEEQHRHADESKDGEESDGERQRPRVHVERLPFDLPVDGRHRPRHADPQEHVDGVAAGDVSNRRIGVLVLDGGHFAGKRICRRKRRRNLIITSTLKSYDV